MTGFLENTPRKTLLYHLTGWLIFIAYEISFVTIIGGPPRSSVIWSGYVIPYLINIGLFYFHALFVLNRSFGRGHRRYILCFLMILSEIWLYVVLMIYSNWLISGVKTSQGHFPDSITLIRTLWRGIYFLIFSTAYWFIIRYFENQARLREAETAAMLQQQENHKVELELMSIQNAFLQSQINPHLLFNTLNFIHNEVQQASEKGAEAVIALSEMMRYSLSEVKADGKVLLENEIAQIDNLMRINTFRFNNKLHLVFDTDESVKESLPIVPLLLMPFVENIFKYAELVDEHNPAVIRIRIEGRTLHFSTYNKKRKTINFHSAGIGINNVRKRLGVHYPGNFSLDVDDTVSSFSVKLTINL